MGLGSGFDVRGVSVEMEVKGEKDFFLERFDAVAPATRFEGFLTLFPASCRLVSVSSGGCFFVDDD